MRTPPTPPIPVGLRHFALALAAGLVLSAPADAAPDDYRWEAVNPYPLRQVGVVLQVRIRDAAGRPQHGATILDARFDKSPDGQPGAYAPVTVLPTSEYGVYAFKTDINTDGRFALTVTAQMPYDLAPATGVVVFTVPQPPVRTPPQ